MRRFWKRDSGLAELEGELRARRSGAPPAFVRALARRADGESRWLAPSVRVVLVTALVGGALAAVASAGGLSVATSSTAHAVRAVRNLASTSSPRKVVIKSAANDQYKPGKGCGDENHIHDRNFQCKVSINDISKNEGNSGTTPFTFTVSLSDTPIATLTVAYLAAPGTASVGTDFVLVFGTLTFAPGVQSQMVTVRVIGDVRKETNETFFVNLFDVRANGIITDSQGLGTIVNDD